MTALGLARAMGRRWYVVALGIALTVVAAMAARPEVVYWAELKVTVVQPLGPREPRTLENVGSDPIAAATMLMEMVNKGRTSQRSALPDATLYGEGKREAVQAALHDVGGQWVSQVREPVIDVQAVSHDAREVLTRLSGQVEDLSKYLATLQDTLEVVPSQRLTLRAGPAETTVRTVTGSRVRAVGSTLLIGLGLTVGAVYWLEQLVGHRRRVRPSGRGIEGR